MNIDKTKKYRNVNYPRRFYKFTPENSGYSTIGEDNKILYESPHHEDDLIEAMRVYPQHWREWPPTPAKKEYIPGM